MSGSESLRWYGQTLKACVLFDNLALYVSAISSLNNVHQALHSIGETESRQEIVMFYIHTD